MRKSSQNVTKTGKKTNGKPFQPGPDPRRGRNGGRPKSEHSLSYWLTELGNTSPLELADTFTLYADELRKGGPLPFFALIALRILMQATNEPDVPLLALLFERLEGKQAQPIDVSWREVFQKNGKDPAKILDAVVTTVTAQLSAPSGSAQAETTDAPQQSQD